jgi:hypothetical protein
MVYLLVDDWRRSSKTLKPIFMIYQIRGRFGGDGDGIVGWRLRNRLRLAGRDMNTPAAIATAAE